MGEVAFTLIANYSMISPNLKMNTVTILISLFTDAEYLRALSFDCAICNTRFMAITSNLLSSFYPSFFALCPSRVVIMHATPIISYSDIQMSTEKLYSHTCS